MKQLKELINFFKGRNYWPTHFFQPQKDPDEFLNENNAIDLETRIKESVPFIDY